MRCATYVHTFPGMERKERKAIRQEGAYTQGMHVDMYVDM